MLNGRLDDPMTELFDAIRSPYTRRYYELRIRQFFGWFYGDKVLSSPQRKGRPLSQDDESTKSRGARSAPIPSLSGWSPP